MYRKFPSGVVTGTLVKELFEYAKKAQFALPAINVTGSNTINAALETAAELKAPIIIQFSNSGGIFNAGKTLNNENQRAAILGAIAGAKHIHELAEAYGATVILHTDHCTKKLLPWIDGLLKANEEYYRHNKKTLFSSHMIDLSEEPLEKNISICCNYLKRMHALNMTLEIELGITGGEEDGMDNINIDKNKLYTRPEEVAYAYEKLIDINPNFIIAASFGNVHGVYNPGNVRLRPNILMHSQNYIQEKYKTPEKPIFFVFHGGSGSSEQEIKEAISYGVIKVNLDSDLQYAFMSGIRDYMNEKKNYLKGQIGNPQGKEQPNKKFYDPRVWLREGEKSFKSHLKKTFKNLNNIYTLE